MVSLLNTLIVVIGRTAGHPEVGVRLFSGLAQGRKGFSSASGLMLAALVFGFGLSRWCSLPPQASEADRAPSRVCVGSTYPGISTSGGVGPRDRVTPRKAWPGMEASD